MWLFFDAFGTLIHLHRFFERLQEGLRAGGHALPLPDVEGAARREFAYYVAHSRTACDAASLQQLRLECGGVLLEAFRERGYPLPFSPAEMASLLVDALAFRAYPDVPPALAGLAARGVRLGLISNWDCSLPQILAGLGLEHPPEVIVVSSLCGCEKPDPAIFAEALRRAGAAPHEAVHVGDSYENDFLGASRAGLRALLLDRAGKGAPPGVPVIHDLRELCDGL